MPDRLATGAKSTNILQLIKLKKYFGGLKAVSDFSMNLKSGELKGLMGPNGAGKSSVINIRRSMLGVRCSTFNSVFVSGLKG